MAHCSTVADMAKQETVLRNRQESNFEFSIIVEQSPKCFFCLRIPKDQIAINSGLFEFNFIKYIRIDLHTAGSPRDKVHISTLRDEREIRKIQLGS